MFARNKFLWVCAFAGIAQTLHPLEINFNTCDFWVHFSTGDVFATLLFKDGFSRFEYSACISRPSTV